MRLTGIATRSVTRPLAAIAFLGVSAVCLMGGPRQTRAAPDPGEAARQAGGTQQTVDLEIVGQIGGASYAVDVEGRYAYVGVGPRLWVVDVADPARPVKVGESSIMPSIVRGVDVTGKYAYVADGGGGLRVIDVSTPTAPREVGTVDTPDDWAIGVYVLDTYAYVADMDGGLRVVDVSTPTAPREVGAIATPGYASGVYVAGGYAYVADSAGLRVIDVSTPTAPREVGAVETPGNAQRVFVSGKYAYVADWDGGLRVIDVSRPTAPQEVGAVWVRPIGLRRPTYGQAQRHAPVARGQRTLTVAPPCCAMSVYVAGNHAYVANYDQGLRVIDVSTPTAPREVGAVATPGWARDVHVAGNHAYVADGDGGLRVIDVSTLTAPRGIAVVDAPGRTEAAHVVGTYAFVAASSDGLQVVDVSTPTSPREVGALELEGNAMDVDVSGAHAYVADNAAGLRVVDVSTPASPREAGALDGSCSSVSVSGRYAYASFYSPALSAMVVIDVAVPSLPREIGLLETMGQPDLSVTGTNAYLADGASGMRVIDVSTPTAPREVGAVATSDFVALSVYVAGNYAYVVGGNRGLQVIDVSTPAAPQFVGAVDTPGTAVGVYAAGDYAYVADGGNGLQVIDVSTPTVPRKVGTMDTPGLVLGVYVQDNYAYVADEDGGLVVVRVGPRPPSEPHPLLLPVLLRDDSCPPLHIFTDVALVIDASTSMLQPTSTGRTKLDAALAAARAFVAGGPAGTLRLQPGRDQVAVVMFNDGADLVQELTSDRQKALAALASAEVRTYSRVEQGISTASLELLGPRHIPEHTRAMVVLSDGLANPVPGETAIKTSRQAREAGILVYVIGVGPTMNEDVLRAMASTPDRFWKASDAEALEEIYRQLVIEVLCPKEIYWGRRR